MTLIIKTIYKKKTSFKILNDWLILIRKLPRTKNRTDILKKITKYTIAYNKKKPVAIACIKKVKKKYREYLSKKTWEKSIPLYELWYCYTNKNYRNKGISSQLIWKLVHESLFATIKEDNIPMQRILEKYNFKKKWNPFWSKLGIYNIILMTIWQKDKKQLK